MDFCHLHVHTEYSTLDGFGKPTDYAKKAKELGFKYLACTDHGNIDGLIKFQQACENNGIKPILGCEAYIIPEINKDRKRGHILLLVKNSKGFRNLTKMLSFANSEGFYYKPRITYDILLRHYQGLIISTACMQSFIASHKNGIIVAEKLNDLIGEDLYFEVMPNKMRNQKIHNQAMIKTAERLGRKVIATNDCHYVNSSDWKAQEVLLAIQRKAKWSDKDRFRFPVKGLNLKNYNSMKRSMKRYGCWNPEYLANTIEIAEKCSNFRIKKRNIRLPGFADLKTPLQESEYLWSMCNKGFKEIFRKPLLADKIYNKRFKLEFNLIKKKNFVRYFIIVYELVRWCKENDILIGPRGSVCGSLMAYLLGITGVDPIKHNLLFSRFISEDRVDYPDIDIDFEHNKREFVKDYLTSIYGHNQIANVSTFSRMKSRAIIHDVARVFEVPAAEVNRFAKIIDQVSENGLEEALQTEEGIEFKQTYPQVVKLAQKLEGQIKTKSKHAGALIVSNRPLDRSGRSVLTERDNVTVINWEKDDAEHMGLMKLDALGLKFLTILSETKRLIKENHDENIIFQKIPLEDKSVLSELNKGTNVGIFQLSGYACNQQIKDSGIYQFSDIPIAISIARPGPTQSGMAGEYNKRRKTNRWIKGHPIYEEITKETSGILVYQEQIMQVISKMAGLPESTADQIRKVIGKKRSAKEFSPYKRKFIAGCKRMKTFSSNEARSFWKGLLEWAGYGFNKCAVGSTKLERSNYNQYAPKYITIEELYTEWYKESPAGKKYRSKGLEILSKSGSVIKTNKVVGVYYQGKRMVYKIKTHGGREFTGTRNHRLLTYNGYTKIKNIVKDSDWLAVKGSKISQYVKKGRSGSGWSKGMHWIDGKRVGYSIVWDKVKSIKYLGVEDVFDVEMKSPDNNYLANDIVSHNSHAVAYALVGYWCAYLKHYYPTEFICAWLTYGQESQKEDLIEEAYKLGLQLVTPMVHGNTQPENWTAKDSKIYIPFKEVKGIGPVNAHKAKEVPVQSQGSLFDSNEEKEVTHSGSFGKLLKKINAYRKEEPSPITNELKKYFGFRLIQNPSDAYKNLYNLFNNRLPLSNLDSALEGDYKILRKLKTHVKEVNWKRYKQYRERVQQCSRCNLINECTGPVPASVGKYNIGIIGQDPGYEEDQQGEGFVGKSGKEIWEYLSKKGYDRSLFYITNINKCFPSETKRSTDSQINACSIWMKKELRSIKPIVLLAFGNNCIKFFTGRNGGITAISGKSEWLESYKCWICWCIHPSATFRNSENKVHFKNGMDNFHRTIKSIGLKKY